MRELFERYIETVINGELRQLQDIFSAAKRNAFWVVEADKELIGTFGIESRSKDSTELRRMYLQKDHRGRGTAQRMLQYAEAEARELGFSKTARPDISWSHRRCRHNVQQNRWCRYHTLSF